MRKKTLKGAALAAMAGCLLQFGFGGCLGDGFFRLVFADLVADQVSPFVPSVGDLFGGGDDADGG